MEKNSNLNKKAMKQQDADYLSSLSVSLVESIYEKILLKFVVEKKYRDPKYTAQRMAEEIGFNVRYVSAVLHLRYRDNFSQLINGFRIREAMYVLTDSHFASMSIKDIYTAVGFANRQSFYAAFLRMTGTTPSEYRNKYRAERMGDDAGGEDETAEDKD